MRITSKYPSPRNRRFHRLGVFFLLSGCTEAPLTAPPEPDAPAPVIAPALTEIRLPVLRLGEDFRWEGEFRGLATAAIEAGLYDIPGVIPVVGEQVPIAGKELLGVVRRSVDARFVGSGPPDALNLMLELCIAGEGCESVSAVAKREAPWEAFATLLVGASEILGQPVSEEQRGIWALPGSKDTYAELLTGRAAAMYYGILPVPDPLPGGNMHPGFRPVLVDPKQPLAEWIWARWQVRSPEEEGDQPIENLGRAALYRSSSALFLAERAGMLLGAGKAEEALLDLEQIHQKAPNDPRFLESYTRALLGVGRAREALRVLDTFPPEFFWNPRMAELWVQVAGAAGVGDLDPLLAHWQRIDLQVVEPVTRRIELRVVRGDYASALELVPALRLRAPGAATDALEAALLVSLGRLDEAYARVPEEVGRRLKARATLEGDATADVGVYLGDASDMVAVWVQAEALLARGEERRALELIEQRLMGLDEKQKAAIQLEKAEVLVTKARVLESLGQLAEASATWREVWWLDPAIEGGPVEGARIAPTFRYGVRQEVVVPESGEGRPRKKKKTVP